MRKNKHYACDSHIKKLSFILLLTTFSCYIKPKENNAKKEIWATVFVHGIMSVQPHVGPNNFAKVISNNVEDSAYYDAVCCMRKDDFFFKNQAMQEVGLRTVYPDQVVAGNASGAIARLYSISTERIGHTTQGDRYYTFGWRGVISPKVRLKAGIQLYRELATEISRLQSKGLSPRIRVIGYSHGGNVALNMATVASRYNTVLPQIDELILMGVPLQPENDYLVTNSLFKTVYNLFSKGDYIQPLDCFSSQCFFSKRKFSSRKKFTVPKKVIQIQIKMTKSMRCNTTTINHEDLYCISDNAAKGNTRYQRNRAPGHVELWFFGWTPKHYRSTFPLYPLPILAVVPQIIHWANRYAKKENVRPEEVVVADLRPDNARMILRKERDTRLFAFAPFLSNTEIDALTRSIKPFKPKVFTKKMYDDHTNRAIIRAKLLRCQQ